MPCMGLERHGLLRGHGRLLHMLDDELQQVLRGIADQHIEDKLTALVVPSMPVRTALTGMDLSLPGAGSGWRCRHP